MITPIEIMQRLIRPVVDVDVVSKVPRELPRLFVRVDMGAPQRINLDQVETLIIVQAYGQELGEVIDLLSLIYKHLDENAVLDPDVSSWDDTTLPVEHPDPDISEHRWQFTGQLIHTLSL